MMLDSQLVFFSVGRAWSDRGNRFKFQRGGQWCIWRTGCDSNEKRQKKTIVSIRTNCKAPHIHLVPPISVHEPCTHQQVLSVEARYRDQQLLV